MQAKLNKAQARALENLRGLPPNAHSLVMCAEVSANGYILEGDKEAFDELVEFIGEALCDDILSAASMRALRSLCLKINPECGDWLGM